MPVGKRELMAGPLALAGAGQKEGWPPHCHSSLTKLQPSALIWFATVTHGAPRSNTEQLPSGIGSCISEATVNLAMT